MRSLLKTVIVIIMLKLTPRRTVTLGAAVMTPLLLASCAGGDHTAAPTQSGEAGACPVSTPVDVVVSVDQWGTVVSELAGSCAHVTTVLAGSSADPHDYEPAPADAAAFGGAQLVVLNGGHYDEWAAKLAASSAPGAPVIDALALTGAPPGHGDHEDHGDHESGSDHGDHDGAVNPHVWYDPATVVAVADAVTAKLSELSPDAAGYFKDRRTEFGDAMKPYDSAISAIKAGAAGKSYAATESVFDDMAADLGLQNRTPQGYQASARNESDPSPADLDAFLKLLHDKGVDVLIYNTQTEGSVPQQLRSAAEAAGIPVVDVTETVAPGANSFEAWQVDQLTSLAKALGVSL